MKPGGVIVEGTAGNTGIGLALVGNARGYRTVIVMPETQSQEKKDMLLLCGVDLRLVPAAPYTNPMNYVRYSGRLAEEIAAGEPNGAIWANQFDNLANRRAQSRRRARNLDPDRRQDRWLHLLGRHRRDAVGDRHRAQGAQPERQGLPVGPDGLGHLQLVRAPRIQTGRHFDHRGHRQQPRDQNLEGFTPDGQFQISDEEALPILFNLVQEEGLVLGGSSASTSPARSGWRASWGRAIRSYDPRRFRHALPVEAVQPRFPQGAQPADPALAQGLDGSEFTDRFGDARWRQRDRGTRAHALDHVCQNYRVRPKLIGLIGRKPTAWPSASTVASPKPSRAHPFQHQRRQTASAITRSATSSSKPSTTTTIAPDCDASATKPPLNSSSTSRHNTKAMVQRNRFDGGLGRPLARE